MVLLILLTKKKSESPEPSSFYQRISAELPAGRCASCTLTRDTGQLK